MQKFTGIEYLKIDIANSFGLDKSTWTERLNWFSQHEDMLARQGWDELLVFAQDAEEPAQLMAGVNAYRKALLGHKSGYTCKLDATASGIQLLAILAGCEDTARMCNLVDTGRREDTYTAIYDETNALLGNKLQRSRKAVKLATVAHFYGSKKEPENCFGAESIELSAYYQVLNSSLPGASQLIGALIGLWRPDVLAHEWTLPDGFDVRVKVMDKVKHEFTFLGTTHEVIEKVNQPKESGLAMGANIVHSIDGMIVREMGRRCDFDQEKLDAKYDMLHTCAGGTHTMRDKDLSLLRVLELADQSGFMSIVALEYIDELNIGHLTPMHRGQLIDIIDSMPDKPFKILTIHD